MQHALTAALRADPRARAMNVTVPCVGRVLVDLMEWLRLAGDLNSGPWLRPQHEGARVHSIRVESDASSRRWGAVLEVPALDGRAPSPPFQAADSFTAAEAVLPINVKEMLAVLYLVMAYVRARGSTALRGARLSFWLDNWAAVANFSKGGGPSPELSALAFSWYKLQVQYGFTSVFQWWGTKENVRADALTREALAADVMLDAGVFAWLCRCLLRDHGVQVVLDAMASPATARALPGAPPLPFVSRYHTGREVAVDIFQHSVAGLVATLAPSGVRAAAYCFPPPPVRTAVVHHLDRDRALVLLVLPDDSGAHFPLVRRAALACWPLRPATGGSVLWCVAGAGGLQPWPEGEHGWFAYLCQF
jgi:hypothetical protein